MKSAQFVNLLAAGLLVVLLPMSLAGCAPAGPEEPALSAREGDAVIDGFLAGEAEALGLDDPPEVERIRFVTLDEWPTAQINCMNDAGFAAQLTIDGKGVDYSQVPEALADQLALQIYTCEAQYPPSPTSLQPLTDSQLRALYAYYVGDLTKCLEDAGFTVGSPPSETVFIESDGGWTPYGDIALSADPADLLPLLAECPQLPAG